MPCAYSLVEGHSAPSERTFGTAITVAMRPCLRWCTRRGAPHAGSLLLGCASRKAIAYSLKSPKWSIGQVSLSLSCTTAGSKKKPGIELVRNAPVALKALSAGLGDCVRGSVPATPGPLYVPPAAVSTVFSVGLLANIAP